MKKQYIFLIMIFIILYLSYLIIDFTYNDNKKNQYIEEIIKLNNQIKKDLILWEEKRLYQESKAYKIKVRKEEQWEKSKWELVIYLTTEEKYNKFTKIQEKNPINTIVVEEENNIKEMSIYQKWMYFIFKKNFDL